MIYFLQKTIRRKSERSIESKVEEAKQSAKQTSKKQSRSSKMQYIGEFIINNASQNLDQDLHHSEMQYGEDMGMNLDDICDKLFEILDDDRITDFKVGGNLDGSQSYTLIRMNYEGRKCEIGEHFGEGKDYFWVKVYAVDA